MTNGVDYFWHAFWLFVYLREIFVQIFSLSSVGLGFFKFILSFVGFDHFFLLSCKSGWYFLVSSSVGSRYILLHDTWVTRNAKLTHCPQCPELIKAPICPLHPRHVGSCQEEWGRYHRMVKGGEVEQWWVSNTQQFKMRWHSVAPGKEGKDDHRSVEYLHGRKEGEREEGRAHTALEPEKMRLIYQLTWKLVIELSCDCLSPRSFCLWGDRDINLLFYLQSREKLTMTIMLMKGFLFSCLTLPCPIW